MWRNDSKLFNILCSKLFETDNEKHERANMNRDGLQERHARSNSTINILYITLLGDGYRRMKQETEMDKLLHETGLLDPVQKSYKYKILER